MRERRGGRGERDTERETAREREGEGERDTMREREGGERDSERGMGQSGQTDRQM